MKNWTAAAVLATAFFSQSAYAALHVYEFSATVGSMRPVYDDAPIPSQYNGWDPAQTRIINVGDKIVGRFTFEDSRAPWANAGSTKNFAETSLYLNSFSFSLPDSGLSVGDQQATMIGRRSDSRHELEMWFRDSTDFVFGTIDVRASATADQPYAIRFDPAQSGIGIGWWTETTQYRLGAYMTSFAEVTAVPEPSTYAMLIAGMGLVAGAARRRRQRPAALAG